MYAYNMCPNYGTKFSPFELIYGRKYHLPIHNINNIPDIITTPKSYLYKLQAKLNIITQQAYQNQKSYQQKRSKKENKTKIEHTFQVGDRVLYYTGDAYVGN